MENLLNRVKDQGGQLLNYISPCFHVMQSEVIFKRILCEHQLSPSVGLPACPSVCPPSPCLIICVHLPTLLVCFFFAPPLSSEIGALWLCGQRLKSKVHEVRFRSWALCTELVPDLFALFWFCLVSEKQAPSWHCNAMVSNVKMILTISLVRHYIVLPVSSFFRFMSGAKWS